MSSFLRLSSSNFSLTRVERTGSREHIQVFYAHDASPEEVRSCKEAVSLLISRNYFL